MPIYWKRYGVADSIEYPLIKRGVVDFAVTGDYTPVQSDVRIHIDAASASYATNVQIATGSHGWSLPMLSSELSGKRITVAVVDASTKAVEDQFIVIETYGSPLAQHQFDLSINTVSVATISSTAYGPLVNTIWATPSRTLTQGAYDQITNQIWATDSRSLATAGMNAVADHVWRRTYANIRASANGDTLNQRSGLGAQAKLVNQVTVSGSTLQIMHEDDATVFLSQTIATNSTAAPITSLDTV